MNKLQINPCQPDLFLNTGPKYSQKNQPNVIKMRLHLRFDNV